MLTCSASIRYMADSQAKLLSKATRWASAAARYRSQLLKNRRNSQGSKRQCRHRAWFHDHDWCLHRRSTTRDILHKDLYQAHAAALNIVSTSTGAAKAVGLVLPELAGKLDGVAIREPTPNVSVVDFKFVTKRTTGKDDVNNAIKRAAEQQMAGIFAYTSRPNVSMDFNHDPHSAIFHRDQTKVMDGTLVRVMSWQDNEWGFSNRMIDTALAMGRLI